MGYQNSNHHRIRSSMCNGNPRYLHATNETSCQPIWYRHHQPHHSTLQWYRFRCRTNPNPCLCCRFRRTHLLCIPRTSHPKMDAGEITMRYNKIPKTIKYLLFGTFLLLLLSTINVVANSNTQIIYPQNSGYVEFTGVYANDTTQNNPSLFSFDIFHAVGTRRMGIFEFNLSEIPFNTTIQETNFTFGLVNKTFSLLPPAWETAGISIVIGPNYSKPINQSTTAELYADTWTNGKSISNITNSLWIDLFPSGSSGIQNISNYTFYNSRLRYDPTGTLSLANSTLENITNCNGFIKLGIQLGLYSTTTISSSLNTSTVSNTSIKPRITYNYTYTPSIVNSSIANNTNTSSSGIPYYFNISNLNNSRAKYCLYIYNTVTGITTTLLNYSYTTWAPGSLSYNQSCSYYIGNLSEGTTYLVWVRIIGNKSFEMDSISRDLNATSMNITMTPINEGYTQYTIGAGTYQKFTTYANNLDKIYLAFNSGYLNFPFFEFNLSRYVPVDAYITQANLSYYSIDYDNAGDKTFFWTLIGNTVNTSNQSSAGSLYDDIWNGGASSYASGRVAYFFNLLGYHNLTTWYDFVPGGTGAEACEGVWTNWAGGSASDPNRNLRRAIITNLTTYDKIILGGRTSNAGAGVGVAISSTKNALYPPPQLTIQCVFNQSTLNNCSFVNNTQFTLASIPSFYINISNAEGKDISWFVMLKNETSGAWTEEYFIRHDTGGKKLITLNNATCERTSYKMYVKVVGVNISTIYSFTTFGYPDYIDEPKNVTCIDLNETELHFSFNPFNWSYGTTWTSIYYQQGSTAPNYGEGILAGNISTFNNDSKVWINLSGLTKNTEYSFSFWTWFNTSIPHPSFYGLSTNVTTRTNTTWYGSVNVTLRFENSTSDGSNVFINLTNSGLNRSTHKFIVYYADATSDTYEFTNLTYFASNGQPYQVVSIKSSPLFYELRWNDTVDISNGMENITCSYSRYLTPYAEDTTISQSLLTFYMLTDQHVYNEYYLQNGNYTLEENINERLVEYVFDYQDNSGLFLSQPATNVYVTIFSMNNTKKLIIDQQYWSATHETRHTIQFGKLYFIGINITTNPQPDFENIGPLPKDKSVDPYTKTIIIMPLTKESTTVSANTQYAYGWSAGATGLWFNFNNLANSTVTSTYLINFTVYNETGKMMYSKEVTYLTGFNFTDFNTANHSQNYTIILRFILKTGSNYTSYVLTFPIYPGITPIGASTWIEIQLRRVAGEPWFYNVQTGQELNMLDFFILIGALIFMGLGFGEYAYTGSQMNAILIPLAPAIFIGFMNLMISGISTSITGVGILLGIVTVIYAIYLRSVYRE